MTKRKLGGGTKAILICMMNRDQLLQPPTTAAMAVSGRVYILLVYSVLDQHGNCLVHQRKDLQAEVHPATAGSETITEAQYPAQVARVTKLLHTHALKCNY